MVFKGTEHTNLSSEDLFQLLTGSDIVSGVEYKQLHLTKECIRKNPTDSGSILLARGKEAIAGTDAYLKFKIEIGPIPGKLLKDGSIDFRERKIMVPVSAGQLIAIKIPATEGFQGTTVLGQRIAPRPGGDIEVKTADDSVYSPETRQVSATSDGVLSVVHDNVIQVRSKQEETLKSEEASCLPRSPVLPIL